MKTSLRLFLTIVFIFLLNTLSAQYCTPVYSIGCSGGVGLTSVQLNTMNQPVTCSGSPDYYQDYTLTASTDLTLSGTYTIWVTAGADNTLVSVWVDYNQDGVFDAGTELVGNIWCLNAGSQYSVDFGVSGLVSTGVTRLRLMSNSYGDYNTYPPDPCSQTEINGNCVDVSVNIVPPPTAITIAATDITSSSATLNATINANGGSTSTSFDYGLTSSYSGSIGGIPNPVSGSLDTPVSVALTGLDPNTNYHYRAVASRLGWQPEFGSDMFFNTDAIAPEVTTEPATNISGYTAVLFGYANPHNATGDVTFEYGLTTGYGSVVASSPTPIGGNFFVASQGAISGLQLNTT